MKSILSIIIWAAVAVGALSIVTTYFVPTDADPALFQRTNEAGETVYLELVDPASPDHPAGTELTPEVLAELSEPGENGEPIAKRVHIKSFDYRLWTHMPHFIVAAVALLGAGLGQRFLAKAASGMVQPGAEADPQSPEALLAAIDSELTMISDRLPELDTDRSKLEMLVERLGKLQRDEFAAFVDARDKIIGMKGMGGYARVMDHFATGERRVNRAWSAAADGYLEESLDSLDDAKPAIAEAREML